ncbi:MAG: response regulator [Patescibacteria group bacterium]|nr:response regulator [Candidatus Omnitrophota bacterium]MBU0976130.1 response regulator [Patescibacteria group bacterium]
MSEKKILIAEDEEFLRSIIKSKLTKAGYEVLEASDGEAALKSIRDEGPSLVLLDLMMPKMNGYDVLKKIQEDPALSKVPVIILSNLGQLNDIEKGKKLGAVDYIVKSNVSINEVLKKVEETLKK